jgi:glycosyltransferase involved in cell wall biosynthesis
MRVLMTTDCVGGVWTYALELAHALAPLGVEVELATMGPEPDEAQRGAAAAAPLAGLHVSTWAREWQDDPWEDVDRAAAWLLDLEARLAPDLVHLNGYAHGALPWRAPVVVAAHSDVLSWWRAVHGREAPAEWRRYRQAVEAGLRAASSVLVPTAAVAADLARSYRLRTQPVVVPNGRAAPPATDPDAKEPFVLAVGRFWDEAKNVEALARIRGRVPWAVVAVGAGTSVGVLAPADLAALRARAAVFCSPARYEPFGLAILEAAHAGCALVLGDVPSLREVWGDAAVFVPPDDDEALAAALRLVARDGELRRELAHRALRRAARYTPQAMAEGTVAVYRRALDRAAVAA